MSRLGVVAGSLWAAVAGLIGAGWLVAMVWTGQWVVALMLALSGCALSALAATLHIKTYACRLSALVRVSAGLDRDDYAGPRALR